MTAGADIILAPAGGGGGSAITALTGDVTASGPGSAAATLAASGVTAGTYGDAAHYPIVTVDAKGRLTAASADALPAVPAPATTVTGPDAFGASPVVGTTTTYARADHDHGLPSAPAAAALATTSNLELTSTSATTVVTYTPSAAGNVTIGCYFRVVTATTTVTLTVTWTDETGAQSLTLVNGVSEVVGSYALTSLMIHTTAAAITVTMTAGTASQVYASASIGQS